MFYNINTALEIDMLNRVERNLHAERDETAWASPRPDLSQALWTVVALVGALSLF